MSQHQIIKSAELVIAPSGAERDVRTVLHTLPQAKGWVFGLFTLEYKEELGRERVAHILNSHLEHLAADLAQEANVVRRFEQTLSRVNRDLSKAAQELNLVLDRFHVVIGVLSKGQIFLSGIGNLKALFLHKTAERRYVIYELDSQFNDGATASEPRSWDKPLVAVLDGEIHPGDIFYLATPVSKLALSLNELQDILVTLPPAGALQRIRQYLPATEHYGALAFQAQEEDKGGLVKTNPINSLQDLEHTKDRTASVLGDQQPDLVNSFKEMTKKFTQKLSSPGAQNFQATLKRALALLIKALGAAGAVFAAGFVKLKALLSNLRTNRGSGRNLRRGIGGPKDPESSASSRRLGGRLANLSRLQKGALAGFFLVVIVFGIIIFTNLGDSKNGKNQDDFEAQVQAIEDKILTAEASLIYQNSDEASQTLSEAATALEALPRETNEQKAEADRLAEKLAELQARIRGVTLVEPSELADIRGLEANASILSATGTVSGVIAMTDNLNTYKLDALNRAWVKQETVNGPISRIESSTTEGGNVLLVDATQQLARVDLTGLTLSPITSGTNGMASVEDITIYNSYLYALTGTGQQIVKMAAQAPNYDAGTPWITARDSDLTTARGLIIDSDVYVLLANDVVKFTSGREQSWQPATIDPPLSQPIDIWTSAESAYLYILDPAEKRIVVLNKDTGGVKAQYVADEFAGAVGMIVDEPTSKIIMVTATQALEFTPQHLLK